MGRKTSKRPRVKKSPNLERLVKARAKAVSSTRPASPPQTRFTPPKPRPRPTRVTVASPSGREGRTITVSSRSILARGRKSRTRTRATTTTPPRRARVKKSPPLRPRPTPIPRGTAPTFVTNLIPFQKQSPTKRRPLLFETFTQRGRRTEEEPEFIPTRSRRRNREEEGSDFDVLNFFG